MRGARRRFAAIICAPAAQNKAAGGKISSARRFVFAAQL
jgi:hypothetical protein